MSRRNFAIDDELFDSKKEKVKRGARGDLVLSYCAIKTVFSVVPFFALRRYTELYEKTFCRLSSFCAGLCFCGCSYQ